MLAIFLCSGHGNAQSAAKDHSVLLLIDISGSMTGTKIDSVKSAAKQIIRMLLPCNTEFSVMGFSGTKEKPVPFLLDFTSNEFDLLTFVDKLKPEGGTPLGAALKKASYSFISLPKRPGTNQSIILLGDGRSDDNVPAALKELKERKALIQCECIGFEIANDKVSEEQLKLIASETKGEYYEATDVSNVIKAFYKSSIKTIIGEVPVEVRKRTNAYNFGATTSINPKMLTSQNWMLDSVQINVSDGLYEITRQIADESMQDTLPKSLVFDDSKKISLYLSNGADNDANKKWIEGKYNIYDNALVINVKQYYFRLIAKKITPTSLVLCVNKFKNTTEFIMDDREEVCDCGSKINAFKPYILIYFSKAGCNK